MDKQEPVKIGAIISLTGPSSNLIDVKDGMELAVDEINSWGGIDGRKIKLVVEDSKSSPEEGKTAFQRLEADEHPDLYVSVTSSVSMVLAPSLGVNVAKLKGT